MIQEYFGYILSQTGASNLKIVEVIQQLWNGYGQLLRIQLSDSSYETVIVKYIQFPSKTNHPRGWNTSLSHQRKVKSYQVELEWYQHWAHKCPITFSVPKCLGTLNISNGFLLIMEDLSSSGFPLVKQQLLPIEIEACLTWLANFHAYFLHTIPEKLWNIGTYWHLDTRPDEFDSMSDIALKKAAHEIDATLNNCKFQTLVHGDAKVANFCFSQDGKEVAAVDFQYVGGGCGMKDFAYFMGSCLDEQACQELIPFYLDFYFELLLKAISLQCRKINVTALENEWRELFPIAWTDFNRFLNGWAPNHSKLNAYSNSLTAQTLLKLDH